MNRFSLMAEVIILFYIKTEEIGRLKRQINTPRKYCSYISCMTILFYTQGNLWQTIKYSLKKTLKIEKCTKFNHL